MFMNPGTELTLSSPVVSDGCTLKSSVPYWSNLLFKIFLTFRHSDAQNFGKLIFATIRRKCGTERVKAVTRLDAIEMIASEFIMGFAPVA